MKIDFFGVHPWEEAYLAARAPELFGAGNVHMHTELLNDETSIADPGAECVSIFVDSHITPAVIDHFPNLKLIAVRATGFDMVALEYAKSKNITVVTVPSYGEHTVAEFTFALMLTLSRKIYDSLVRTKEQGLFYPAGLTGFDLIGKTLGVIGTGRIGMHVIQIAKGFGMKVVAYDPFQKPEAAASIGFEYTTFEQVLSSSDIITIHVPGSKDAKHLIDASALSHMKPSAYLINTSRGTLVDSKALADALNGKKLAGAALDVLEDEPPMSTDASIKNNPLVSMSNVLITPHNAFNTKEATERILETTLQNISAFISGAPQNVIA